MKKYNELDNVFNNTLKQLVFITCTLLIILIGCLEFLRITRISIHDNALGDRFLGFLPTVLLSITIIANQYIGSWATYLRCHKQEPFLVNSVVIGLLCCFSTLVIGGKVGLYGIVIGYCIIICFISLPWAYVIFRNKKIEWHGKK